ncbi:acyl-CoA Delta-9 desaturase [Cylas formicarius]|uniref:acyl-CoA Delta-9 desaturase n=1 Tax=Cylas formicarius TaxID=197179 RepID=UPI002958ACD1|nr:acyl-CoA Delta-9 desaturase [Cylas formicarius]
MSFTGSLKSKRSQMADAKENKEVYSKKRETDWIRVLFHLQINVSALISLGYIFLYGCMWRTLIFSLVLLALGVLGVTAGSHRLWAHGSYKAKTGLRIFLMLCQTLIGHGSIYDWVKWHRLHHKYYETDLDPYNPSRGFFYAHILSTTLKLSPAQEKALEEIDMSDLENDKVVMFQKRWYKVLFIVVALLLPINAPAEYWGENLYASTFIAGWLRYTLGIQISWLIHSASRIWGLKKGEKFPADTNLVFLITKSYWLSYHHLAPWDYQTSEFGKYGTDCPSKFIRVCAALGYASDLKLVDSRTVRASLIKSVLENKPITDCLLELSEKESLPQEHYLTPDKYY